MMQRLLRIARTEVLEHRRQPWMLFILALNYALYSAVFGALFLFLEAVTKDAAAFEPTRQQLAALGVELDAVIRIAASTFGSLSFTNLPLFVAIMSGTSVLHDRESGTLPFLMLAPLTRRQLLAGKLAGAMALPLLLHLVFVGAVSLTFGQLHVLAPFAYEFGGSAEWWVAFLVGAPASAAFVGALGTVISARSRDVRTSMQFTSFFIGLLSLGIGAVLIDGLTRGLGLQLAFAAACLVATAVTLTAGARLLSRDVTA
jgi:ABC-type transport system involved in multi-copper enzyme maturation permease subunit